MHTQSQPFRINSNVNATNPNYPFIDPTDDSNTGMSACTCDSILSRIIYGFKHYSRVTQSLNLNGPLNLGGQASNPLGGGDVTPQMGTGPLGFAGFN